MRKKEAEELIEISTPLMFEMGFQELTCFHPYAGGGANFYTRQILEVDLLKLKTFHSEKGRGKVAEAISEIIKFNHLGNLIYKKFRNEWTIDFEFRKPAAMLTSKFEKAENREHTQKELDEIYDILEVYGLTELVEEIKILGLFSKEEAQDKRITGLLEIQKEMFHNYEIIEEDSLKRVKNIMEHARNC